MVQFQVALAPRQCCYCFNTSQISCSVIPVRWESVYLRRKPMEGGSLHRCFTALAGLGPRVGFYIFRRDINQLRSCCNYNEPLDGCSHLGCFQSRYIRWYFQGNACNFTGRVLYLKILFTACFWSSTVRIPLLHDYLKYRKTTVATCGNMLIIFIDIEWGHSQV